MQDEADPERPSSTRPAPTTRRYRSPLRAQQSQRTKEAILAAFADLVVERGVAGATMTAVAQRAGVADRTVYRHFPNGEALLDGLSEQASIVMRERGADLAERGARALAGPDGPGDTDHAGAADGPAGDRMPPLDALLAQTEELYEGFEAAGQPMKAAIIAGLGQNYRSPTQPGRVEALRRVLRRELPHLSERHLSEALVMIRFQLGGQAWYLLTQHDGLTTRQAARLSARAVRAFVDDLREQ